MEVRNPYSPRVRVFAKVEGESKTNQNMAAECDINNIMRKYKKTGFVPVNTKGEPVYGDFSGIGDYQENMNKLIAANDAFMALPSYIRKKFANDPANYVDYCLDESNNEEAVRLGLKVKKVVDVPDVKDPQVNDKET